MLSAKWMTGVEYQWTPLGKLYAQTVCCHYNDVMMSAMASQITSLTIVYSTVYSGADQRKHQSSASLAFVRGIHRWPVNSPHKWPVTRKMFPFDDVIMVYMVKKYCGACVRFPVMFIFHLQTIICWKEVRFMFWQSLSYPAEITTYIFYRHYTSYNHVVNFDYFDAIRKWTHKHGIMRRKKISLLKDF